MSKMRSWLSRLFRFKQKKDEVKEPVPPQETPQAVRENAPSDPALLELPMDHALYELHRLRTVQSGPLPRPQLRMKAPETLLSEKELQQELGRLKTLVTVTAAKRLKAVRPKAKQNAEEEPPAVDAQALVFLPKNKLSAWLMVLPPANGGKEADRDMLSAALQSAKVSYGINESLLDQIVTSKDLYFRLYLAAVGQPPVHGRDGSVAELFARNVERKFEVNDQGQVDYASLNLVQNVSEGEVICRIVLPTEGQEGRSVLDGVLPAKNGRPVAAPKGQNTELTEDGTALIASCAGHVEFNGRGFEVQPLLEIGGNVDFSTGNIKFLGDVHIHGDVCSGFKVWARGSIIIDGVVEASVVEAGGDITVIKGVQGNEQATIHAQRNVFAKFLENCCVCARGDLQADCVINCDVYCDGTVHVRAGRGKIIGGSIRAGREVNANTIGSRSELPTLVILGGQPCAEYERNLLESELRALHAEVERVTLQPESPAKLRKLSSIRLKINLNKAKQQQCVQEEASNPEEEDGQLIFNVAHAGTEIVIGSVSRRLNMEFQMATARLAEGEICLF